MTLTRIPRTLPPGLEHYSSSPEFTSESVPPSLLKQHATKSTVWGLLRVQRGRLRYCLDTEPPETLVIEAGSTVVIEPEATHHVEMLDPDCAFVIEFHRPAGSP